MDASKPIIQGFRAGAVAAGIGKKDRLDLGLIFSEREASAAGVFTRNKVKAAPVILSRENLQAGRARAIIANSGNANACTGEAGLSCARGTAERVARELGVPPGEVLVASTGVIGAPLNMEAIDGAVPELVRSLSPEGLPLVVEAIMTTDSFPKTARFDGEVGGKPFQIFGMAKGAGMIMPDMATMLCFILTDIAVEAAPLRETLSAAVESSFNRITVDGDTSTNDMVLVMANGVAGNADLSDSDRGEFLRGLKQVMGDLAWMIVKDGEGATKVIEVRIRGAASPGDAERAARVVANSPLVKTTCYGQDPNWGRIMAALGRSGAAMAEEAVDIWVDDVKIVEGGLGRGADREREAAERMKREVFSLIVDLHQGACEDTVLTCDFTHEYVSINADYRT
ncbi:MAG: bifunctional glutamate N-acetyltransferase/amino-acid acetyltransferase ArgJ [Deltaproteobacteria bacterium]|nr:bifunctional glutamate N-acetyltransferase/amino-acid acetyltransferase ArgJ [Deltaproteobacteria bacterium]